jgi:hypothetical protein
MLAGHLAEAGLSVAIVEGGPPVNTCADFNTHAPRSITLTGTSPP